MNRSRIATILTAVLCIAFIMLRLWRLTDSCLWFDEIFSVHAAEHPWNSILSFVALDLIHPPLFYVLLKLWIGIGGESLFWLRLLPVTFAVVSIFPLVSLMRELKQDRLTQLICLFFVTVNGSLLKYSQEVRMYSLLMCIALFSMWLFARYFIKGKSFLPLLIVNILLVYTHYFGWFVVISEVAAILIFQRIKWRRIVTMFAIIFAAFLPWVIAIWQAAQTGTGLSQNIGWMSRPDMREVGKFLLNLIEPIYSQRSSADPVSILIVSVPILLLGLVAQCLCFANWKHRSEDEKQATKLLVLFTALPVIFTFAMAWLLPYSIWGTRHLIIVMPTALILLSTALTSLRHVTIRTGLTTLVVFLCGYGLFLSSVRPSSKYSWCAWEELVNEIPSENTNDILVFEDLVAYHTWFATRGRDNPPRIIKITSLKEMVEDKAYFLPRGFDGVAISNVDNLQDTGYWLLYRERNPDAFGSPDAAFERRGYKTSIKGSEGSKFENEFLSFAEK